jgi:hypothetical protein
MPYRNGCEPDCHLPLILAESRVLRRPWFPAELRIQRAEALVWAPAAFRKHGVYLSARDLEAA